MPSMQTTTKPSSASDCISSTRGPKLRDTAGAGLRTGINVIDDRIFLRRVEMRGREHHAVEIGLAVTRLHCDRGQRLPSVGHQLRDVLLGDLHHQLAVAVAHNRRLRLGRRRVGIDEIASIGGKLDAMVGILRREQLLPGAVEVNAVEMLEVWVAARFLARRRGSKSCGYPRRRAATWVTLPSPCVIWFFSWPVVRS